MVRFSDLLEVFIVSVTISLLAVPIFRIISLKTGYLDHPQNNKRHAHSTPLLGGAAIFLAFLIGILSQWDVITVSKVNAQMSGILGGAVILLILGLVDDKTGMGPEIKLLGQFIAAMVLYKSGFRITFLGHYYLDLVVTYLWIIGMTNSFNLLDNMNGLSAGIAVIAAFFFGVISWMNGQGIVSIISFCLCGSCLGFLRYNFPRARIFMGDAGSLIIGMVLSTIAIAGNWKSDGFLTSISIPILVLAYPIFDTTLVTIIRISEGRSVFQGGKDHSSHRLALLGLRTRNTVIFVYLVCLMLGISAVLVTKANFKIAVITIVTAASLLALLGIRLSFVDTGRFGRKKGLGEDEKK